MSEATVRDYSSGGLYEFVVYHFYHIHSLGL